MSMTAKFDTGETQSDVFAIDVLPHAPKPAIAAKVAVFDPNGDTETLLSGLGIPYTSVGPEADPAGYDIFVIGRRALTLAAPKLNLTRVPQGLKVIVFEQTGEVLEQRVGFRTQEYGLRDVFPRISGHPALAGLTTENLHDWRGEATTVPPHLDPSTMTNPKTYPQVQWCGFTTTRAWRCGCEGDVATVLIEKPAAGNFLPIIDGGFALQYSPLMEYREGAGMVLFCQLDVTGRTENDPAAARLVGNLLDYVSAWKPASQRQLLYVGQSAGKRTSNCAGLSPADYQGGPLTADQVLAVGPEGGAKLAAHAKDIQSWLKAGGRLLGIGLDRDQADAFLPFKTTMRNAEYVCGSYALPAADSPFSGIAPADLYNRRPRELSLVSGGTVALGDGVLAKADGLNVVFCQLVPWQFDNPKDYFLKPTFRRSSFALSRLLANMGAAAGTPLLRNLQDPLPARVVLEDVKPVGKLGDQPKDTWHRVPREQVWLEAGQSVLFLPDVWKGLWVGKEEPPKDWETAGFDDSKWRDINVPGTWQSQFADLAKVNDVFLYRTTIDVPAEMARRDVVLLLGSVDDEDWTYVNGRLVGSITEKTNPRDHVEFAAHVSAAQGASEGRAERGGGEGERSPRGGRHQGFAVQEARCRQRALAFGPVR